MSHRKGDTKEKFWLYAFRDHLANLKAYSSCIDTADVSGDGEYKLLAADGSKKLKVYSGTSLESEIALLGVPSAITSFYMKTTDAFTRPCIAVAIGPYVFTYRNGKPLYRFTTPPVPLDPEEIVTWAQLTANEISLDEATAIFERKLDQGVDVSTRTLELLLMDSPVEKEAFVLRFMDRPLVQNDLVVCLAELKVKGQEEGQPGCLVYGTEKRNLYVMENDLSGTLVSFKLQSTPVSMFTAGSLETRYRIVVTCRDGRIYFIADGTLSQAFLQPDAQPCSVVRCGNHFAVATMANTLTYYTFRGIPQGTVYLPVAPTNLTCIQDAVTGEARGIIVALSNGEIRVYVEQHLQHVSQAYGTVTAMRYGRYGREDSALVLVLQNGSLVVELLHRNANLSVKNEVKAAPPPEQEIPIPVPKLSSVFMIQTAREKEYGIDMYRNFQLDLCHLKLLTSKSYLAMMTGGELPSLSPSGSAEGYTAPIAPTQAASPSLSAPAEAATGALTAPTPVGPESAGGPPTITMEQRAATLLGDVSLVRFVATVQGLGPVYKVKGTIQNTGDVALHNILVVFVYDAEVYTMPKSLFHVPFLVPGIAYPCDALIELKEGETKGDGVLALVLGHEEGSKPLASTLVALPEAELFEGA